MRTDQIDKIIKLFQNSNKIFVFTGAGISTNCGIPDFRSESGLYNTLKGKYKLPYPEAIFDINYFIKNPGPFFDLSRELFFEKVKPSKCHSFIAWLEEQNKISLVMTQNIDMLHQKAGSQKIVECHGSYQTSHCLECRKLYDLKEIEPELKKGEVLYCDCGGVIKPDIVFFGENLPANFHETCQTPPEIDLLLVLGSSLSVQPAASFPIFMSEKAPSILINREETLYDDFFDHAFQEDLDSFTQKIWEKLK